ncbi:MAG: hypothetical protein PHC90_13230 [Syntrophorhabdaceae bacterium]|nr:hypothetical protein [Syntrophorhabdaceae bacterium]
MDGSKNNEGFHCFEITFAAGIVQGCGTVLVLGINVYAGRVEEADGGEVDDLVVHGRVSITSSGAHFLRRSRNSSRAGKRRDIAV